jgi:hypothetical protein
MQQVRMALGGRHVLPEGFPMMGLRREDRIRSCRFERSNKHRPGNGRSDPIRIRRRTGRFTGVVLISGSAADSTAGRR